MNMPKLSLDQWAYIIYNAGLGVEKLYELATKDNITPEDIRRAVTQLGTYRPDPLEGEEPPAEPPAELPSGVAPYLDLNNLLDTTWTDEEFIPRQLFVATDNVYVTGPNSTISGGPFYFVLPMGRVSPALVSLDARVVGVIGD